MKLKDWTESDVVNSLCDKNDIRIIGRQILCLTGDKARNDIGIKSKGKIDFLTRYYGYQLLFVDEFPKR